jgi:hypothetical protein
MSTKEKRTPSFKDGSTLPIKQSEATVLKETYGGATALQATKAAGLNLKPRNAKTYVEHVRKKYEDAQGNLLVSLDNIGVTLDSVARHIKEGLHATRPMKAGKTVIDKPDFNTRHKYVETTLDIMGAKAPKQLVVENIQTHEQTVTFVDSIRNNPDALLKIRERLRNKERTIDITEVADD